jgi:hypothetical protein
LGLSGPAAPGPLPCASAHQSRPRRSSGIAIQIARGKLRWPPLRRESVSRSSRSASLQLPSP